VAEEKTRIWTDWEEEERGKGVPQDLIDMRWAYKHPEEKATGGRIIWQRMLLDNPAKFRDVWQKREEEYAALRKPVESEVVVKKVDDGLDRCVQLASEWLAMHRPKLTTVVR
jgi:hypothetical protein